MKSVARIWLFMLFAISIVAYVWLINPVPQLEKFIPTPPANNQIISKRETATVSRVVDGDTIEVSLENKKEIVRLIGIDAPETVDPEGPVQCFGKESSDKAKKILTGKAIILESDKTQANRDEYGRLLRYVFLPDGTNFDKFMISEGFAREYTFKNNPYKYQSEFIQTEKKAKEEKNGLWGSC